MKTIRTKQFQILTNINLVWDFLTDIYDREYGSGVAAPFFEHAILASWMDNSYSYLNRFWFDGDRTVAFVFYEAPATDIYFSVRKGYEFLADEDYCKSIGIPVIVFHVEKTNERAHQLYQNLGYLDNEDQGSRMRMVKELKK